MLTTCNHYYLYDCSAGEFCRRKEALKIGVVGEGSLEEVRKRKKVLLVSNQQCFLG